MVRLITVEEPGDPHRPAIPDNNSFMESIFFFLYDMKIKESVK